MKTKLRPDICSLPSLTSLLFACGFAACTNEPGDDANAEGSASQQAAASTAEVVTLTAPDSGLSPSVVGSASIAAHPIKERFAAASSADALIITMGASGIRPLDKEQLLIAGILQPSITVAVLTGSATVGEGSADSNFDAAAFLNKKAAEIKSIADLYGVKGLTIATDSADAPGDFTTKGWDPVLALTAKAKSRTAPARESSTSAEATIHIPKMSESPAPHAVQSIKNGNKRDLVFAGGASSAVVELDAPIKPGESGQAELKLQQPQDLAVGDKFIITRMGNVVAYGEISEL